MNGNGQLGFDTISDAIPRKLVRVTPSKLSTWADCPRRYRMAYIDRPTPPRGGAWAHNSVGLSVHNALRAYFDLPVDRRTPDAAAGLVVKHWIDEGFADSGQSAEYRERAGGWVGDYVAGLDPSFEPLGLERWVSAPVGTIIAEGRADRIDERGGELVIVDYKTGRHVLTADDAASSQALAMYAVAAARTLRRPCHRVELHHLPSGTVAAAEHDERSLERQLRRAQGTADDIALAADTLAAGGDVDVLFPPVLGRHCSWCDFRRSCAEGQRAAPDLDPWSGLAS